MNPDTVDSASDLCPFVCQQTSQQLGTYNPEKYKHERQIQCQKIQAICAMSSISN